MAGSAPRSRFSKAQRLLSRADFDRVQNGAETRRASSTHFLVLLHRREDERASPRLGIIASRRVGSAVRRNRAKRLVREWFRAAGTSGPIDMVVVVKTGAETLTAAQAAAELASALTRARSAKPQGAFAGRARPQGKRKA